MNGPIPARLVKHVGGIFLRLLLSAVIIGPQDAAAQTNLYGQTGAGDPLLSSQLTSNLLNQSNGIGSPLAPMAYSSGQVSGPEAEAGSIAPTVITNPLSPIVNVEGAEAALHGASTGSQMGEFEQYVAQIYGKRLPRFGSALVVEGARGFAQDSTTTIPMDYALNPGDELLVGLTGSVESNLQLVINRDGRIFIPHVGSISVAGMRYGDLPAFLTKQVGQLFRDFKLSVSIGHLHGIRVYVTGFAANPGAFTLSSLSTLVNAVMSAGGPSAGGSFRSIQLRRNGQIVTDFDFYGLLLNGDKTRDAMLQNEDTVYIGPIGPEVAITGSVNAEGIFEVKPGETLGDILRYAGGLNSVADDSRTFVERLSSLDKLGWQQLDLETAKASPVQRGDILTVVSVTDIARPIERQAVVVKIEGEVDHPGRYYLEPDSKLSDLLAKAGNTTSRAYLFGTEFDRVSVKQQQEVLFDQALQDMELALAAVALTQPRADVSRARGVINRLKARKPDGRLILPLTLQSTRLPDDFVLENNDRIYIPPKPTTVGVFGAVYRPGSFYFGFGKTIGGYLKLAGGPQEFADRSSIFVVRANGAVVSGSGGLFARGVTSEPALPGDVIFVPVRVESNSLWDKIIISSMLFYQLAVGGAAVHALTQ